MLIQSLGFISRVKRRVFLLCLLAGSSSVFADNKEQTLIIMGSEIETCTTLSPQFCNIDTPLRNEKGALYSLTPKAIKRLEINWPTDDKSQLVATVSHLNTLLKQHPLPLSKQELLWAWRDIASKQLSELSQIEFDYVIDMLEISHLDGQRNVFNIDAKNSKKSQDWLTQTYKFIAASLKVKTEKPTLLVITTAARDPYASANYYETLLSQTGVALEWLPLTPGLAKALHEKKCEQLDTFRVQAGVHNRANVYPKRVAIEQAACLQGTDKLIKRIKNSTGVILIGAEFDTATDQRLRTTLFDSQGNAYPWTSAIADSSVLVTSGYSGNLLSGGRTQFGPVATVKPISSLAALRGERSVSAGGVGSITFALLDTYFSEQNRTIGLAKSLAANMQPNGIGIDENTSLVVIKSPHENVLTVLGERGVVHLKSLAKQQFQFNYWPSGAVVEMKKYGFILSKRSIDKALPTVKIPALPMLRFDKILTDAKLRSLTQAMCLSNEQSAVGQQDEFIVSLDAAKNTQYHRINSSSYGCAIEQLKLTITTIQ